MSSAQFPSRLARATLSSGPLRAPPRFRGVALVRARPLSRRQCLGSAAGAAGLALGWDPASARADGSGDPVPIPGGFQVGGATFHAFAPGFDANSPADQEPSTITDFNGFV